MLIAPNDEQGALVNIVANYLQGRKGPTLGGVKAQAHDEGKAEGYRVGVADALGYWLSVKRRQRLPHLPWVELIGEYEVREALAPFVDRFFEVRNSGHKRAKDEPTPFDLYLQEAVDALMELVAPAKLIEADTDQRRGLILKGEADPTDDDVEWLVQRRSQLLEEDKKLAKLIAKTGAAKVNG